MADADLGRRLMEAARKLIGTPHGYRGRSRSGIDCGGVPIAAAREVGALPYRYDFTDYAGAIDGKRGPGVTDYCGWPNADAVVPLELRPGDVATLSVPSRPKVPYHVGVIGEDSEGGLTLIHFKPKGAARVVEEPLYPLANGMTVRGWRFRGPWPHNLEG